MIFTAQMRLGSLELLAALAFFAAITGRLRTVSRFEGVPLRLELDVGPQNRQGTAYRVRLTIAADDLRTIGRSHEADVPLDDREVSRRHAGLQAGGGLAYVTDLGSVNGTFLNGKRLAEGIELRVGDYIDVGSTRIVVREVRAA